jgi:hydroxymethylpyrimidine/phosphomethylpyrimidine kinase
MGVPNVLSIAGSDPSGGAGIQADLKTFAALGVYGCAIPAMLTAQGPGRVTGTCPVTPDFVALQLATLLDDMEVHAVKVGALGTEAVAMVVTSALRDRRTRNIVVDPVTHASIGVTLLEDSGARVVRDELCSIATVVTPNTIEANALLGSPDQPPATTLEMAAAARAIKQRFGPAWVLVTGGHLDSADECVDVLTDGDVLYEFCAPRIAGPPTHGTGCTLSSAIAAFLALGCDVPEACLNAQQYVAAAIAAASELTMGSGPTPLHHIPLARAAASLIPADLA